jgi:membrane protein DedA with SNARE-associated domain
MDLFSGDTVAHLLATWGYGLIALGVGLESMGLPLPGETLLISAALYAGTAGRLDIHLIVLTAAAAAIVGDNLGYAIGRYLGEPVVLRWGRRIGLTEERVAIGRRLFARHGAKVVIFGRFIALLRTLSALVAGIVHMPWRRFLAANAAGGIGWSALFGYGSFLLGDRIKQVKGPAALAIGAAAAIGFIGAMVLARRQERRLAQENDRTEEKNRAA